ncbi:branched-chain amino acid transaminase [Campylobacter fetus]|uniref:branched-chain amino acid transaminase n=1 Tax=Campylobacter fetus TaxID=196 RepID=UPI001474AC09|nr:branched-chain amino acid transaminase [Campylobacter fetus]EFU4396269.1 branched-chain amino acid transaminase [Campylobacter fetus]EJB7569253.1 branched-chain amino acid transaminase [Campylobacter fetus]EJC3760326.1 branched-chain amino acid transaminase [Campylobacter fetus]EJC3775999.1 branched-chain amino acid transaminase [Campylobacter fetus]EJU9540275.1 branched-chain amino acid transaminase [Campylobacter fetus]
MPEAEHIWFDGKLIKWKDATVHVLTHSLHYGNAVFEGVRAYKTPKGLAIFKLKEHTKRLFESAKACGITIPFSQDEINKAHIDLLKSNTYNSNVYIRPLVFLGYGKMGVSHIGCPVNTAIAAWQWGAYMGDDALENGIKVTISSWIKPAPFSMMAKAKASANYFNSQMANYEAQLSGYDEALLLDPQGFIAEGSGECFFIVKNGVIITPPNDTSLESITQKTVIDIAKDLGYEVVRQRITRDEAYTADEAFFTGTAAEVTPISNIDGRIIGSGKRGVIATQLQAAYFDVVMGKNAKYEHFVTYIK